MLLSLGLLFICLAHFPALFLVNFIFKFNYYRVGPHFEIHPWDRKFLFYYDDVFLKWGCRLISSPTHMGTPFVITENLIYFLVPFDRGSTTYYCKVISDFLLKDFGPSYGHSKLTARKGQMSNPILKNS